MDHCREQTQALQFHSISLQNVQYVEDGIYSIESRRSKTQGLEPTDFYVVVHLSHSCTLLIDFLFQTGEANTFQQHQSSPSQKLYQLQVIPLFYSNGHHSFALDM